MKPRLENPPKIELRPPEKRSYDPLVVHLAASKIVITPRLLAKLRGISSK